MPEPTGQPPGLSRRARLLLLAAAVLGILAAGVWWYACRARPEDTVEIRYAQPYSHPVAVESTRLIVALRSKLQSQEIHVASPILEPIRGPLDLGDGITIPTSCATQCDVDRIQVEVLTFSSEADVAIALDRLPDSYRRSEPARSAFEAHGGGWLQDPIPERMPRGAYLAANGLAILIVHKRYAWKKYPEAKAVLDAFLGLRFSDVAAPGTVDVSEPEKKPEESRK